MLHLVPNSYFLNHVLVNKSYIFQDLLLCCSVLFQGRRGSSAESDHHMKRSQSVSQQLGG
jgi:hypothetical protein